MSVFLIFGKTNMTREERTERLRALLVEYELTPEFAGKLLNRSPKTIYNWRTGSRDSIPEMALALLEIRTKEVGKRKRAAA